MNEAKYSLTTKVDGDLFTVRADTPDEFRENLRAVVTNDLISFITAVQDAARQGTSHNEAVAAVKQAFPNAQVVAQPAAAPVAAAPAFGGTTIKPTCRHGERAWKEGVSKAGKPYSGWLCQSRDRNDQCEPQWGAK